MRRRHPLEQAWFRGAVLVATLAASAAGAATLYKWTDAEGRVQYSDRPPPEAPAGGYDGPRQPTVREAIRQQMEADRRAREEERVRQRLAAERLAREEQARAALNAPTEIKSRYSCDEARRFHAYYSGNTGDLYQADSEGTMRLIGAADRAALIEQWHEAVTLLCKGQAAPAPGG